MPLPFILGGLTLAVAGYGLKKSFDASDTADEINIVIKKANDLKEEAIKKAEPVESDCKNALMRLGEKKFHVQSYSMSSFVKEFNQLKGREFVVKVADMQDLYKQVLSAQNLFSQPNTNGMTDESIIEKMLIGYGSLGVSSFITAMMMGGELVTAILGFFSTSKMEEKLDDAKAYYSQVEAASKKADVMIDDLRSVEKMAKLFTRQITKFDALFFSLAQEAIATMKKHHYDTSHYNQKEKDQLCVTVSTLMTLSAFLKVSIMDKQHQKLTEKAKNALNLMRKQMDSLENGNYSLRGIRFRQAQLEDLRDDKTS
ncbi:sortase [Helicobacter pylori]|uniref:sortase n=1 Tax=Helicobacter pylori TaxID=210 RepID=UPI00165BE344|nr:sortase [Helicobacter pylori]MBH0235698.1 sortase [Helicobacter pylori]MBH0251756.1 sortase [Helicobacter pylori]MBH0270978.1 sortase [Helicobacter pylori]WQY83206.1 sortase [Helicobacter pylori]